MNVLVLLCAAVSRFGDRQGVSRPLDVWPKHIHMTYRDLSRVPSYVHAALKRYAPGYRVSWYDDADCLAFMQAHASARAQQAYRRIPHPAHRADLWRYHVLQELGGVYLDVDLVLKVPLDSVFRDRQRSYTAVTDNRNAIFNAILVSTPRNAVLDVLIERVLATVEQQRPYSYDVLTRQFYQTLMARPHGDWQLFQEKCSRIGTACDGQLDRYGLCCNVFDGDRVVMGSRYPRFPF